MLTIVLACTSFVLGNRQEQGMAATDAASQPRSDSFTIFFPHAQAAGRSG